MKRKPKNPAPDNLDRMWKTLFGRSLSDASEAQRTLMRFSFLSGASALFTTVLMYAEIDGPEYNQLLSEITAELKAEGFDIFAALKLLRDRSQEHH